MHIEIKKLIEAYERRIQHLLNSNKAENIHSRAVQNNLTAIIAWRTAIQDLIKLSDKLEYEDKHKRN